MAQCLPTFSICEDLGSIWEWKHKIFTVFYVIFRDSTAPLQGAAQLFVSALQPFAI